MQRVYLPTYLSASTCYPVFKGLNQLVSSCELGADHLQQLVEFCVIRARICLDFGQEVVVCERGSVMH
jgi:hypothetical protein